MDTRRPLKRAQPKLGPPDIYPQDPKQKEDELTSVNVKQGYTSTPLVSGPATLDEFGSAKNANIDAFGVYFSALLSEKHRINTLKDTQTKKQLVNTKEIWYVHAKTKHAVDNWFRDLANGTKTLGQLGKRIPIFNSKEGMFAQLYESHVPFSKAVWFIKMSAVHAIALSESSSKSKKRQVPDQYQELTAALTKYLKEISMRVFELYQQSQHSLQQIQHQQQQQSQSQQQQQGTQLTNNSQQPMQTSQISQQPPSQQQVPTNLSATSSSSNQQASLISTVTNPQSILLQRNAFKTNQQTPPKPASSLLANSSSSVVGSNNQPQQHLLINNHNFYRQQHPNQQQFSHFESSYSANSLASSLLNHISNFTANQHTSVATIMTSHITSASALSATTLATLSAIHEDFQNTFSQWQYQTQLARYLFDEGLLDRYDFLCFLLELIEKKRPINEMLVKFILPFILEYVIDFSRSAVLSRRLAHVCAKKLYQAMHHHPMSARSIRRNELAQQQQQQQQQQSDANSNITLTESSQTTSSTTTGKGFNLNSLSDARNAEANPAVVRNTGSNNSHSAANSILDIVKAQLIDGHGHLCDELANDQENNESNLYRNAIYILSSILQVICIECPTAMVRHHIIDAKFPPTLQGSPLDHLPCLPSSLPMMESDLNFELRRSIHDAEREILQRSAMADAKWSCNNSSKMASPKAALVNRLLTVLDILDKHNFDKIEPIDSHDLLYSKIFPPTNNLDSTTNLKTTNLSGSNDSLNHGNATVLDLSNHNQLQSTTNTEHSNKKSSKNQQQSSDTHTESDNLPAHHFNPHEEKHVVKILCEWAITTQRTGEHRASVVARLLERRQSDLQAMGLTSIREKKVDDLKTTAATKSGNSQSEKQINSPQHDSRQKQQQQEEIIEYTFQNLLVQFLDEHAPVIDENQNDDPEVEKAFYNLVLLFGELIRCDVFSHHNYMCTLISRGMFNDLSKGSVSNTDGLGLDSPAPGSNYNAPGSVKPPRSAGRESDSLMTNPLQEFNPLSVSTNPTYQSNQLDAPDNKGLGDSGNNQSSLRSLGFSPVLSQSNEKGQSLLDNHIDDVDADLGKILQDIKEGQQDEAADILLPDYLGGNSSRDDNASKNSQINKLSLFNLSDRPSSLDTTQDLPNVMSASSGFPPNSVESTKPSGLGSASVGADTNDKSTSSAPVKSLTEYRHMMFVKHFPVPDDESFLRDNNQRNILLHGFGKKREDARHAVKKLNKEINKMFGRRASRDINDGGRVKKLAIRDGFSPEAALNKFESLNRYDQHVITNTVATTVLEMFTGVSNGQTFLLPTLESISFVFDLFSIASNITGLLERIVPILEELPDVEAQIKLKCPLLSHQYTHSIALCIIGMLYRYHSCVLLLPRDELCSIFESLHKLVAHIQNPAYCMTSTERVIFNYLFDLYSSQTGKVFDQFSGIMQKIKQARQSTPPMIPNTDHEWTPTVLSNIVSQLRANHLFSNSSTNPILNASAAVNSMTNFGQMGATDLSVSIRQQLYSPDSPTLRHLTESPSARYKFVCDAIFLSATSPYPDLVNDIAVLCADLTAKCPALVYDWIQALQALCCSAQRELSYRQLLNKINISDPQVMNNIAVFTAILVARRCLELDAFIIECAIAAILAPLGQAQAGMDKQYAEPGVRLTCHLLLTLFRNRDTTASLSSKQQQVNSGGQNMMSQPYYGCGTPSYSGGMMGGVPQIGLLQSIGKVPDGSGRGLYLKYLCDHHLLRSACCSSKTQCHITLLKAIRVLAVWATPAENPDAPAQNRIKVENHFDDISADGVSNQLVKDLDTQDSSSGLIATDPNYNLKHINLQTASLHQFAEAILRLLSSQRWLHDKCLSDSELFTTTDSEKNILLDPKIDVKQSQRLLYLICYNKSPEKQADVGLDDPGSDQIASIVRMFENLDVWSMRLSLLRLQFMFAFCKSQSSVMLNDWLDNLARAVVDFFQKASQEDDSPQPESQGGGSLSKKSNKSSSSSLAKNASTSTSSYSSIVKINKVWLIEPLLDKLTKPPSAIHSKIIKASAALMESASVRANSLPSLNQTYLSTAAASTKFKERTLSQRGSGSTNPSNLASTSLLGFQPFLSLLLSCLKNQDKERETLLTSLNSQLYQAIHEKVDDIGYKQSLQDGLELRLCLIGQMFDTIQKSPSLTSDWATLLLLLVMSNLVDPQVDYGLYVSVLDMLAMLIHSAYVSDPIEQREESKKQYQNLMKKFRKELAALEEKSFLQMKLINPLMPLVRQMTEVITCEPMGSLVDTKGEKIEDFFSIDKKKGLKVSELQEVSPWDLIEGHKNPAPLSWPWFGAVRLENKPLRADENNRLMAWHTHTIHHNTAHYCQAPNTEDHHGPPSAKRSHTEKKPSQSNPLLKSLIEANDDSSPLNKSRDSSDMNGKSSDDSLICLGEFKPGIDDMGRDDLIEDFCEMPVDLLFDSGPVETMIEDIKNAMQTESAVLANRIKPAPPTPAPPSPAGLVASSVLAAPGPHVSVSEAKPPIAISPALIDVKPRTVSPMVEPKTPATPMSPMIIGTVAASPKQQHLTQQQHHIPSPSPRPLAAPQHHSTPPPPMPPLMMQQAPMRSHVPRQPPPQVMQQAMQQQPPMMAAAPAPSTRNMSPSVRQTGPKKSYRKKATKKDTLANAVANQPAPIQQPNPAPPQISIAPQLDQVLGPPISQPPPVSMGGPQPRMTAMIRRGAGMRQQQPIVQPPPPQMQQSAQQQQQAQAASVYDFPGHESSNQFVARGSSNSFYEQPPHRSGSSILQPPNQRQQSVQMSMQHQQVQHQHQPTHQSHHAPHPHPPSHQQSQQQQQQHPHQHQHQLPPQHQHQSHQHQHQQSQQQQQQHQAHPHPHAHPHQQQQPQQQQQQHHYQQSHQQHQMSYQQHHQNTIQFRPQQQAPIGHQQSQGVPPGQQQPHGSHSQHQHTQQQMFFQPMQQQQQQQQPPPPQQQQLYPPQQTSFGAGHSRPALTAMLNQKHAAAGNMHQGQQRFNFN